MKKIRFAAQRRLAASLLATHIFRWAALAFFAAMVLVGSIPGKAEALSAVVYDKLLHFVAYSLLSVLVYGAIRGGPKLRAAVTVCVIGLFGAFDEGVQSLFTYRNSSVFDWQVDLLAAAITVAVLFMLHVMQPASRNR